MTRGGINNEYFHWLSDLVCGNRYSKQTSYSDLLMHLHNIEFTYVIPMDQNRAEDGLDLRYRFAVTQGYKSSADLVVDYLGGSCSVFEMMVALAVYCEEEIMDDPTVGDRTGQWFWGMVSNLGLGAMYNSRFDRAYVDDTIAKFLNREYEPDGRGGLFRVRNCDHDMRDMEIIDQLYRYLNSIT